VTIDAIRNVLTPDQKEQLIEKITAAMIEVEGEHMRSLTWVRINEFESGDWAIGDRCACDGQGKNRQGESGVGGNPFSVVQKHQDLTCPVVRLTASSSFSSGSGYGLDAPRTV
jgi:4-oxalocrotonate tautomerase